MTEDEVIKGSLWQVTVYAAFQRAKVYSDKADEPGKKLVKKTLEMEIYKILKTYTKPVTEDDHCLNIVAIADTVNTACAAQLIDGSIPIGVVQKAFNLYLKLMWCLKEIHEPPHCPLDKVIIDKLPVKYRKSWTRIRDIETYKILIAELKNKAGTKSLAIWELETYEKP